MKKILLFIIVISFLLVVSGCKKNTSEGDCCECKDCPQCDVCCPCDNPYLNR